MGFKYLNLILLYCVNTRYTRNFSIEESKTNVQNFYHYYRWSISHINPSLCVSVHLTVSPILDTSVYGRKIWSFKLIGTFHSKIGCPFNLYCRRRNIDTVPLTLFQQMYLVNRVTNKLIIINDKNKFSDLISSVSY